MPFAILCTIIGRASANIGTPCSVILFYFSIENSAADGRKYIVNQADGMRRVRGWWDSILLVLSF